jgi:two-component system cell cycle response regulator
VKTRILVIEDNPDNMELITYLLKQYGYATIIAMDGEAGLAAAQKEIPDLIVCDIQLPKLSGTEIAKRLKSDNKLKGIPLIAVTAYSMVGDRDKLLAVGFDGYIAKPIDPENFVKQIEQFLQAEQRSNCQPGRAGATAGTETNNHNRSMQGSILIVDDTIENAELSRTLLESLGFSTTLASNVKQALEMLEHVQPDLILSDMHIPDINGLDFLTVVKNNEKLKSIPFVIISSSRPTETQKRECMKLGAAKLIFRPIESQEFIKNIKEIWQARKK